jgi:hypothetical protein
MRGRVLDVGARAVPQVEDAGQRSVEISGVHLEYAVVLGVSRPSAREAVRLQFGTDRQLVLVEEPGALLDGVAELVREHEGDALAREARA